jgi:short-subunit dehydrogenase
MIIKDSYTLITGASSGIGLEIADYMAKKGFNLIITSRTDSKLKKLSEELISKYGVKVEFFSCDLADPSSPNKMFEFCESKGYFVEILINNAGYAIPSTFEETSMEEEEKFIRVLGVSVIAITKLFIPKMIKNKHGKIMIVSSVAAFAPPSSIQVLYGPIKTFMNRFSEGINLSYNYRGITSTAVCPGYTVTNFHSASGVQDEMDRVPGFLKKPAKRIAIEGVDAMFKGTKVCIPTKTWTVIGFLINTTPKIVFDLLSSILAPGRYDKK